MTIDEVSKTPYNSRMTGFTKLFAGLVHSTVWREEMHVKVVWITMLALADRNGQVAVSLPGLADASRVTLPQCEDALRILTSPDQYSRTKAHEGRRIHEIDGGWQLLNYLKYRELRSADERRIATRDAVQKHRAKTKAKALTVSNVSHGKPMKATVSTGKHIAEAEAEAEVKNTHTEVAPTALVGMGMVAVKGNSKGVSRGYADVVSRITQLFADVATSGRKAVTVSDAQELQADMIFAYWAGRLNHETAMLDTKRVHRLKARLTENKGNVHELLFAVDGARKDDHLMGRNGNGRKYDGIETIFRDRGQVERLAEMGGYKSGIEHPQAAKYAAICALP